MSHIWMQHTEHHGKAEIPAQAADMWALKGWEPCEASVDADPAMAEHRPREFAPVHLIPAGDEAFPDAFFAQATDEPSAENTEEH